MRKRLDQMLDRLSHEQIVKLGCALHFASGIAMGIGIDRLLWALFQ